MTTVIEEFTARLGWKVDTRELRNLKTQLRDVRRSARQAGRVMAGAAVAVGFGLSKVMKQFSLIEDAEAAFTPVLKSAERAKSMVEQLNETAATTPFRFATISKSASMLLPVMNDNIAETIRITRMLGDTAGGSAKRMDSAVRGFTRIAMVGKADMESLRIIAEAQIPIFQQLSESLGVKMGADLFKRLRDGKISFEDVTAAFEHMTSKGGIYFKGMEIASKTLTGRWSTMLDVISLGLAGIGKAFAPSLKGVVLKITEISRGIAVWAKANQALLKTKFEGYLKDIIWLMKKLWEIGGKVSWLISSSGGLGNSFKILAGAIAIIKLAPLLHTMGLLAAAAPTLAATMSAAGAAIMGSWLPVAGMMAAIFLLVDDIQGTLAGKDSAGNWVDEKLGLSKALGTLDELIGKMFDLDAMPFMTMFNPIVAKGFFGAIEDGLGIMLEGLNTAGLFIDKWIVEPMIRAALLMPDLLLEGLKNTLNIIRPLLAKIGMDVPEIKGNFSSGMRPSGSAIVGGGLKKLPMAGSMIGRTVLPSMAGGTQQAAVYSPNINVSVQATTGASAQEIGDITTMKIEKAMKIVARNVGR